MKNNGTKKTTQAELEAIEDETFLSLEKRWTRDLEGMTEDEAFQQLSKDIERRIALVDRAIGAADPREVLQAYKAGLHRAVGHIEAVAAQAGINLHPGGEAA